MTPIKTLAGSAALALLGTLAVSGTASAGTWHLNAASCPDLREDMQDARRFSGFGDRREDYIDRQTIDCPVQSWRYEPDPWDRPHERYGDGARYSTPGLVRVDGNGNFYRTGYRGRLEPIRVRIDYPYGPGRHGLGRPQYRYPGYRPDRHEHYRRQGGASVTFHFSN